jgi:hypothetical protein
MSRLAARLLFDLGRVEQGGNDCRGADADRDPGLDQLGPALLVGLVEILAVVAHRILLVTPRKSKAVNASLEAA